MSGEEGAVLCRGLLWISDLSGEFYLLARKHLYCVKLTRLMLGDEKELLIPEPEEGCRCLKGSAFDLWETWNLCIAWLFPLSGATETGPREPTSHLPGPWADPELQFQAGWAGLHKYERTELKEVWQSQGKGEWKRDYSKKWWPGNCFCCKHWTISYCWKGEV